jgi:hypothetical protein
LHDLQQDGFDIKLIGIGAVGKEITDGAGEPVALCSAVFTAPVAGDGNGKGRPEAQGVPDAEVEVRLDCFYAPLVTVLGLCPSIVTLVCHDCVLISSFTVMA